MDLHFPQIWRSMVGFNEYLTLLALQKALLSSPTVVRTSSSTSFDITASAASQDDFPSPIFDKLI